MKKNKTNTVHTEAPYEAEEQKALIEWLILKKIFHFAPTNENNMFKENQGYARTTESKAKAMGKLKGASDLVVFLNNKILFIELKRQKRVLKSGKLSSSHLSVSKEQIYFIEKTASYPYAESKICYGAKEAILFIESHKG